MFRVGSTATNSSTEAGSDLATKVEQMYVIRPDRPWFDAPERPMKLGIVPIIYFMLSLYVAVRRSYYIR